MFKKKKEQFSISPEYTIGSLVCNRNVPLDEGAYITLESVGVVIDRQEVLNEKEGSIWEYYVEMLFDKSKRNRVYPLLSKDLAPLSAEDVFHLFERVNLLHHQKLRNHELESQIKPGDWVTGIWYGHQKSIYPPYRTEFKDKIQITQIVEREKGIKSYYGIPLGKSEEVRVEKMEKCDSPTCEDLLKQIKDLQVLSKPKKEKKPWWKKIYSRF